MPGPVCWATSYEGVANSFGFAVHNDEARAACVRAGWQLADDAPLAVHVVPPARAEPLPGRVNVAYVAWESPVLPPLFAERLAGFAAVAVTASFLVEPFRRLLPGVPVAHVPLGVDPAFSYVDRSLPARRPWAGGRRFRFLWCGAPNGRKGPEAAIEAFRYFCEPPGVARWGRMVELYIKTTVRPGSRGLAGCRRLGEQVVMDCRRLPRAELVRLYQSAHCFVFPSTGEGFGLTAAEAARTGCPVIAPLHTALTDLFDRDSCLVCPTRAVETDWSWDDVDGRGTRLDLPLSVPHCDPPDICRAMVHAVLDPPAAFEIGRRGADRVACFTWDRTAELLTALVAPVYRAAVA